MDGECYALVWTPDGSEFQGVNPDGTAAGDSKVIIITPATESCQHTDI